VSHPVLSGIHGQGENGEEIVIDSKGVPNSPRRRRRGGVRGSRLDDSGHGGESPYLIQSRLSPLEIVGSRVSLHRIQCASWRKRSEDRAWNKTLTKTSVSMALDQMISDGVSHDYARYRSLSASMKRSLRRFARQIAIPKTVKDFHETCGYFCGKLKPSEVG
jgi:hypothetical protein